MDRAELKARARAQLGGGIFQNLWMMGLAVCLLIGLLESAAAGIIPGIGALLVVGPLEYGMAYIFLKQARDHQPVQLGDMFRGFQDDFGGTFLIGLMTSLFTFLWSLLFVIPGIVKAYAYSMAYYIKLDHPDYGWNACITASRQLMDGHKWEKFVLDLSFLGWIIVGSLCLGSRRTWKRQTRSSTNTSAPARPWRRADRRCAIWQKRDSAACGAPFFFAFLSVSPCISAPGSRSGRRGPSRRRRRRWRPTYSRCRRRRARGSRTSRPERTQCSAGRCRCTCGKF